MRIGRLRAWIILLCEEHATYKRTVFVSTESLFSRGTVERGGRINVSSHVGSTRFGGGGTRGDARPEPFDGVGDTDVRFDPLTSSGFAFDFGDGEGGRWRPGTDLDARISRASKSFPARDSGVTAREGVLPRSSTARNRGLDGVRRFHRGRGGGLLLGKCLRRFRRLCP